MECYVGDLTMTQIDLCYFTFYLLSRLFNRTELLAAPTSVTAVTDLHVPWRYTFLQEYKRYNFRHIKVHGQFRGKPAESLGIRLEA